LATAPMWRVRWDVRPVVGLAAWVQGLARGQAPVSGDLAMRVSPIPTELLWVTSRTWGCTHSMPRESVLTQERGLASMHHSLTEYRQVDRLAKQYSAYRWPLAQRGFGGRQQARSFDFWEADRRRACGS
jgi:hypothetical protein